MDGWMMDGQMTCDFTSYLKVFQSYLDNGWVIMGGLCNGTLFAAEKIGTKINGHGY